MATCTGAFVWGWYATASNSMCRFSNRSAKKLQSQLKQRRIVFVGDSMTRSIFYAFSRAMGDDIGATYDATLPKHSDVSREIGTTQLEFRWDRVNESYDGVHYPPQVYDAGAQILANAMDWVISDRPIEDDLILPRPGSMAILLLGLIMSGLLSVGLFLFDGFFGVSYMASLFVKGVKPNQLYEESFTELHKTVKLPLIRGRTRGLSADKEIFGLLGNNAGLEMASNEQYSR